MRFYPHIATTWFLWWAPVWGWESSSVQGATLFTKQILKTFFLLLPPNIQEPFPASSLLTTLGKNHVYWAEKSSITKCSATIQNLAEWSPPPDRKGGQWGDSISFCECRQTGTCTNASAMNCYIREDLGSPLQNIFKLSINIFKFKILTTHTISMFLSV